MGVRARASSRDKKSGDDFAGVRIFEAPTPVVTSLKLQRCRRNNAVQASRQMQPGQTCWRRTSTRDRPLAGGELNPPFLRRRLCGQDRQRRLVKLDQGSLVRMRRNQQFAGDFGGVALVAPDGLSLASDPSGVGQVERCEPSRRPASHQRKAPGNRNKQKPRPRVQNGLASGWKQATHS